MGIIPGGMGGGSGAQGPQGQQGLQGPQGPQGEPGPVGPAGLKWRGQWSDITPYAVDDAVSFSGASYFCIGPNTGSAPTGLPGDTAWALLAAQGPVGPQGAQGESGPAGPQGPLGPSGPVGPKGDIGDTGSQGPAGPQGVQGDIGLTGPQGPTGLKGDTGTQGIQGQVGPAGPQGPAGTPAPIVDTFLLDVFTWTGSQTVANGAFLNFLSMAGMVQQAGGTAGVTVASGVAKLPAKAKPSGVTFSTRIGGTVGGSSGTAREWKIQTRRADGTTVVGSTDASKTTGTDISNRDAVLESHTSGATDAFTTQGVIIGLQNDSGSTITLTSVSVRLYRQVNAE